MPLLLEHCGLHLRSATITIGFLSMFFSGYRIIKESTEIAVLKSVENNIQDADLPKDTIPILLKLLYMGISAAVVMFLCGALMLFGVFKNIPNFLFLWVVVTCVYIFLDMSTIIYMGVIYYNLSTIALSIGIASFWYALQIYFIIVVGLYFKALTGRFIPGSGYQNVDA